MCAKVTQQPFRYIQSPFKNSCLLSNLLLVSSEYSVFQHPIKICKATSLSHSPYFLLQDKVEESWARCSLRFGQLSPSTVAVHRLVLLVLFQEILECVTSKDDLDIVLDSLLAATTNLNQDILNFFQTEFEGVMNYLHSYL